MRSVRSGIIMIVTSLCVYSSSLGTMKEYSVVEDIPSGGGTIAYPGFIASDGGINYDECYAITEGFVKTNPDSENELWVELGSGSSDSGWVVFKYQAAAGETITDVAFSSYTTLWYGYDSNNLEFYWKASYDGGSTDPDPTEWNYIGHPRLSDANHVWTHYDSFNPNSNEVYIAYRLWRSTGSYYRATVDQSSVTFTTVPEPVSTVILALGGLPLLMRRRSWPR